MEQPTMAEIERHSMESYIWDTDPTGCMSKVDGETSNVIIRKIVTKACLKWFGAEYRKVLRKTGGINGF